MPCQIDFIALPAEKAAEWLSAIQLLTMLARLNHDNANYTQWLTYPQNGGLESLLVQSKELIDA